MTQELSAWPFPSHCVLTVLFVDVLGRNIPLARDNEYARGHSQSVTILTHCHKGLQHSARLYMQDTKGASMPAHTDEHGWY